MPAPAIVIYLAPQIARLAAQLFGTSLRRSAALRMGVWRNRYPAWQASARSALRRGRHDWQRTKIPVYGSYTQIIPAVPVIVPAGLAFEWSNPDAIPATTPQISYRATRNVGRYERANVPVPEMELILRNPPPRTGGRTRGPPPEKHRRRKDQKNTYGFNRIQQFQHRLLDTPSELLEFWHAFQTNADQGLYAVATALAANEAVDYTYGTRGRILRDKVYRSGYWKLPVGYDTLSRLWR